MAQYCSGEPLGSADSLWPAWLREPDLVEGRQASPAMTASEQMFFLAAPLAHVIAYEEHLKSVRTARAPRSNRARLFRLNPYQDGMAAGAPDPTVELLASAPRRVTSR